MWELNFSYTHLLKLTNWLMTPPEQRLSVWNQASLPSSFLSFLKPSSRTEQVGTHTGGGSGGGDKHLAQSLGKVRRASRS